MPIHVVMLVMPAWQPGRALGMKIVTVFPGNTTRSLPAVHGTHLLLDAATGMPVALLDGTALTLRRTAAASALAADFLARPDATVHLMVGTGAWRRIWLPPTPRRARSARPGSGAATPGRRRRLPRGLLRPGLTPRRSPSSKRRLPPPTSSPARRWRRLR